MRDEAFCNNDGARTDPATAVMDDPSQLSGATLGTYVIQELLGVGGMGKVYKAEHSLLGRPVALKLLHEELSTRSDLVQRFFNEGRAVNQIRHENIIDVTDFGTTPDGRSYFVMELLD
ncbi:MAG TPA: protein kinase, partial [Myxococcota bacterium]|nr:protein kinase [Myxococcota bacterium]